MILKLGASSMLVMSTFAASVQSDSPFGPNPENPRPERILAP